MDISIGCGGLSDLKSYLTIRVHKSNAEACKTNQMLSAFYASKKDDNMDRNNARASSEVAKKCSSVARGGGGGLQPPLSHWHVDQNAEWAKHYVFSTFETVLCTGVD